MKQQTLLKWLWFFLGVAFAIWIASSPVWADERNDIDFDVGDTVINSGTGNAYGLGFSHALGDVDINDCLASTQKTNVLFGSQKLVYNLHCLANAYQLLGKSDLAARMRCQIEPIRAMFVSDDECIAENTIYQELAVIVESSDYDEDEGYREEQQQAYENLQQEMADLRARPAQRVVVKQDPELALRLDQEAQRRAKARAILEGEK